MEFVIELMFELVFDGLVQGAKSPKLPLPLRILLAAVIVLVFLGTFALFFYIAWSCRSWVVFFLSLALLVLCVWGMVKKIRTYFGDR